MGTAASGAGRARARRARRFHVLVCAAARTRPRSSCARPSARRAVPRGISATPHFLMNEHKATYVSLQQAQAKGGRQRVHHPLPQVARRLARSASQLLRSFFGRQMALSLACGRPARVRQLAHLSRPRQSIDTRDCEPWNRHPIATVAWRWTCGSSRSKNVHARPKRVVRPWSNVVVTMAGGCGSRPHVHPAARPLAFHALIASGVPPDLPREVHPGRFAGAANCCRCQSSP